ncbi:hypothetical protein AAAX56_14390, partial [Hominicoprocola fusiformis]
SLFSFTKENSPLSIPQEKGFDWQSEARTAFMPPECKCLRAASPRLVLLYDLTLSYYPLLRSRWQLCCLTDAAHPLRVPLC